MASPLNEKTSKPPCFDLTDEPDSSDENSEGSMDVAQSDDEFDDTPAMSTTIACMTPSFVQCQSTKTEEEEESAEEDMDEDKGSDRGDELRTPSKIRKGKDLAHKDHKRRRTTPPSVTPKTCGSPSAQQVNEEGLSRTRSHQNTDDGKGAIPNVYDRTARSRKNPSEASKGSAVIDAVASPPIFERGDMTRRTRGDPLTFEAATTTRTPPRTMHRNTASSVRAEYGAKAYPDVKTFVKETVPSVNVSSPITSGDSDEKKVTDAADSAVPTAPTSTTSFFSRVLIIVPFFVALSAAFMYRDSIQEHGEIVFSGVRANATGILEQLEPSLDKIKHAIGTAHGCIKQAGSAAYAYVHAFFDSPPKVPMIAGPEIKALNSGCSGTKYIFGLFGSPVTP